MSGGRNGYMLGRMVVKGVNGATSVGRAESEGLPGVAGVAAVAVVVVAAAVLPRVLARRPALAVPVAAAAGAALPGCECGSVPIAGRLVARGALPGAALAFLLSAPAINPVVLTATAVAFPGRPEVVVAR